MEILLFITFVISAYVLYRISREPNEKELKRMRDEFVKSNPVTKVKEPIRRCYTIKGYDGDYFQVYKSGDEEIDYEYEKKIRQEEIDDNIAYGEYIQSLTPEEFAKFAENNPLVRKIDKNN